MRAIDYFDRGAAIDPGRVAMRDATRSLTFAEAQALSKRIAVAMADAGFPGQSPVALYAPNSVDVLLSLLGMWRAGAKWIPVNTRNAMDANVAYMNYVRCGWLFYHSQSRDDVRQLMAAVPTSGQFICIDKADNGHPALEDFIAGAETERIGPTQVDRFGNLDELVGIFPTGGTTGPAKGACVTNLGWGTMMEIASATRWRVPRLDASHLPGHRAADARGGPGVDRGVRARRDQHHHAGLRSLRPCSRTSRRTRSRICICRRRRCTACSTIPSSAKHDYSSLKDLRAGRFAGLARQAQARGRGVRPLHVPMLRPGRKPADHHLAAARNSGGGRGAAIIPSG